MKSKLDEEWGEEKQPLSIDEKAESELDEPVKVIRSNGQYLIHPDGREERIGPDHPLFDPEAGF